MTSRHTLARAATIALTLASLAACAGFYDFTRLSGEELDAGAPAETGAGPTLDGDTDAGPPPQDRRCFPGFVTDASDEVSWSADGGPETTFTVALEDFQLFPESRANLDGIETQDFDTASCLPFNGTSTVASQSKDGDGGTDGSTAEAFRTFAGPGNLLNANRIKGQVDRGQLQIAFFIEGYNGTPNDEKVTVSAIPLVGLAVNVFDGGIDGSPVLRRGNKDLDEWVRDADYASPGGLRVLVADGTVRNGLVEVTFSSFAFKLAFFSANVSPPFRVALKDTILRGKIVPAGDGEFCITQGELAGRWLVEDFLQATAELYSARDQPFCTLPEYQTLKAACRLADLAPKPNDDFCPAAAKDPNRRRVRCGALSSYSTFETYPVSYPTRVVKLPPSDASCDASLLRCE